MTTIAKDSSGNGNDGVYVVTASFPPTFVQGVVAGDLACDLSGTSGGTAPIASVVASVCPTQWDVDWTVEMWLQSPIGGAGLSGGSTVYSATVTGGSEQIVIQAQGASITVGNGRLASFWSTTGMPDDGLPHHLVITKSGFVPTGPGSGIFDTTVVVYLDGTALTLTGTPNFSANTTKNLATLGGFVTTNTSLWITDEFAIYPTALSSGAVSAHYAAASTSFAAYTAAVLADSPTVYYHLNDGAGRGWYVGVIAMGNT